MKAGLLFIMVFFFACSSKDKVPRHILPPDKMQSVIWDLMRADELVNYYKIRDSTFNQSARIKKLYDTVLLVHQLSSDELKKNIRYYESRPDLMKIILDSLQKKNDLPSGDLPISVQ